MSEPVNVKKGYAILAGAVIGLLLVITGAIMYDEANHPGGTSTKDLVAGLGGIVVVLVILLVGFALYFLPSIVAIAGNHHNAGGIIVLNLLLGWTFIGWVIALVWAFTSPAPKQVYYVQQPPPNYPPPGYPPPAEPPQYNYQKRS